MPHLPPPPHTMPHTHAASHTQYSPHTHCHHTHTAPHIQCPYVAPTRTNIALFPPLQFTPMTLRIIHTNSPVGATNLTVIATLYIMYIIRDTHLISNYIYKYIYIKTYVYMDIYIRCPITLAKT